MKERENRKTETSDEQVLGVGSEIPYDWASSKEAE